MTSRAPSNALVTALIAEEASREGIDPADIWAGVRKPQIRARKAVWRRLVKDHGRSIVGTARVWGCDRRCIQRALQ